MAATPLLHITFYSGRDSMWALRIVTTDEGFDVLEYRPGFPDVWVHIPNEIHQITADFPPADLLAELHDQEGEAFYNDTTI